MAQLTADGTWSLRRPAVSYDRAAFTDPQFEPKVRTSGLLGGGPQDWGITGWVEYDFSAPTTGWYEVLVDGAADQTEFVLDPTLHTRGAGGRYMFGGGGYDGNTKTEKIANVWLDAGAHTIRVQRFFWTGFPKISGLLVRASDGSLNKSLQLQMKGAPGTFRRGECPRLEVSTGYVTKGRSLEILIGDARAPPPKAVLATLSIPSGGGLTRQQLEVPCDKEGVYMIATGFLWSDVRPILYEVVDTRAKAQTVGEIRRTLVQSIDLAATPPDYAGGGSTRIAGSIGAAYRESGDVGWTKWQRTPDPPRSVLPEPSWFAYRLDKVEPQVAHLLEVDYPNDALRTFAIALRESAPLSYPVAGGVDSGGEFSLSGNLLTYNLLFWPRAGAPRLTFLTAHSGRRAAARAARVYRVESPLPALLPREEWAGRHYINWYEEGRNFLSMYGARSDWPAGTFVDAANRWAEAVRYAGGTVLSPTAVIYSFAMYPSGYHRAFENPEIDDLRRIVLVAEKHALKVLPELHPRADELAWPFKDDPDPKPNLLVSKDGRTNFFQQDGKTRSFPPLYNPLHPENQRWLVQMIGELVDRYKDSPALLGVNLRTMEHANPALNNFHSLAWGYDDLTVGLFVKETGAKVPGPLASPNGKITAAIAKLRYDWLTTTAREQWIAWRCRKIAELYSKLRDRVRAARPDLKLYTSLIGWQHGPSQIKEAFKEAGIDADLLGKIDGVVLINGTFVYGRREAELDTTQRIRDLVLEPNNLKAFHPAGQQGAFLSSAYYLEATDGVVPPVSLGFPPATRRTWMSAVAHPAGRHVLEPLAVQLAETDAHLLGDGGNGYSLGQPVHREFLAEFLRIPAQPFQQHPAARDPVAVWSLQRNDGLWFYAVNRDRHPATVRIALSGARDAVRVVSGAPVALQGGALTEQLAPYQLVVFRATPGAQIASIATSVSPADQARVEALVAWLKELAAGRAAPLSALSSSDRTTLAATATEAATALKEGRLWRARTVLELSPMIVIYQKIGRFPPGLRDPDGS
jgi:hypothetical protein